MRERMYSHFGGHCEFLLFWFQFFFCCLVAICETLVLQQSTTQKPKNFNQTWNRGNYGMKIQSAECMVNQGGVGTGKSYPRILFFSGSGQTPSPSK